MLIADMYILVPKIPDIFKPDMSRVVAHTLCAVSAGSRFYKRPYDWWSGVGRAANLSVIWQVASNPADSVADWAEFPGCKKSGPIPRYYRKSAVLSVNKRVMDAYASKHPDSKPAVAYKLGSAIVAAVLPMTTEFPNGFGHDATEKSRYNGDHYDVALGIGRGVLQMAAGRLHADGRFIVPADAMCVSPHEVYNEQLPKGIPRP